MHPTSSTKVPLSESSLWKFQKDFYQAEGTEAWNHQIPFFSTNNMFIADAYAEIIVRMVKEQHPLPNSSGDSGTTFYLLELGAGVGLFSFYLLSRLRDLMADLEMDGHRFIYIMCDFVEDNISSWKSQESFKEFIADGRLGFAEYEAGSETGIRAELHGGRETISIDLENPLTEPLIVIANYFFDSLPCDIYKTVDQCLYEGLTRPEIKPNLNDSMNISSPMDEAGFDFTYEKTPQDRYANSIYNKVLNSYRENPADSFFVFPKAALDCLAHFACLSSAGVFVLSTDKGYGRNYELFHAWKPEISLHSSAFSISVNYHALAEFSRLSGGAYYMQATEGSIYTSAFSFGFQPIDQPECKRALKQHIDHSGPSRVFNLCTSFERNLLNYSIEEVLAFLSIFHWDPFVLTNCMPVLIQRLQEMSAASIADLTSGLKTAEKHFYKIPGLESFYNDMGAFYQAIQDFDAALECYQKSEEAFGPQGFIDFNRGVCLFAKAEYEASIDAFRSSISADFPNSVTAKGWILCCQEELAKIAVGPVSLEPSLN